MNSLKSLCRCAKGTPVACNELEENLETSLWCQIRVELIVRAIGILKTAEHLGDSLHELECTTARPVPSVADVTSA
jgi:hypothetical protein